MRRFARGQTILGPKKIFDTTLVTVMRLLAGRRPSQGGRDHSSHRLVAIGLRESTAVAVLWTLAALGGADAGAHIILVARGDAETRDIEEELAAHLDGRRGQRLRVA